MGLAVQVRDVAHGGPATGVEVRLERQSGQGWQPVGQAVTDDVGCVDGDRWPASGGVLRIVVGAEKFFASLGLHAVLAELAVTVRVADPADSYRIGVLLTPGAAVVHTEGPLS